MIIEDQSIVTAFLTDASTHGNVGSVEVMETHISAIFLVGDRAYKLKRAVRLPYADFSTPDIRLAACDKEYRLNKATSPAIYLGVRRITRAGNGLVFDGTGELVDAVVEMVRFDQASILDDMAQHAKLEPQVMSVLAREIAAAHRKAEVVTGGGAENIEGVLDINRAGFHQSGVFSQAEIETLDAAFIAGLQRLTPILDKRAAHGCIRRCHGDLHLRNICMFDGRPQLFDCIDFNDQLATVDVLYDLAFLAMDLWHRELQEFASLIVNHYLDDTLEEDGFACLPYFIALRAAVRAHVLATQSEDTHIRDKDSKRQEARRYYDLAMSLLEPDRPRLIAIGGFSGSGKSTVASKLAPLVGIAPGARLIESDRTRKALFGVAPEERLPESAYLPEVSEKVYEAMATRTAALLKDGCVVVTDAVFDRTERRQAIENVARTLGVAFDGLWLQASPGILKQRIETRRNAASDATSAVLDMQLARASGDVDWHRVQTSTSLAETIGAARKLLKV